MGEEFYCILKLVSGEEVISLIAIDENDGDPIIIAQSPLTMKMVHGGNGSYIKVKPWMDLTEDEIFFIRPDKVITMTETRDPKLIDIYTDYINNDELDIYKPSGKVKVSKDMGYVSTVNDARDMLEKLYKEDIETKDKPDI
mgnify:FL=1|tara:strand:- start:1115 stop:1537 length:423 start_codon:yes stop_codon:yes gene_type:complete